MMTRGMRGRPAGESGAGPQRPEPSFQAGHSAGHGAEQEPQHEQPQTDEALEIPAFLRRQTS